MATPTCPHCGGPILPEQTTLESFPPAEGGDRMTVVGRCRCQGWRFTAEVTTTSTLKTPEALNPAHTIAHRATA